ncbi:unnamed protein product, partial [Durusdinium trenchii]
MLLRFSWLLLAVLGPGTAAMSLEALVPAPGLVYLSFNTSALAYDSSRNCSVRVAPGPPGTMLVD